MWENPIGKFMKVEGKNSKRKRHTKNELESTVKWKLWVLIDFLLAWSIHCLEKLLRVAYKKLWTKAGHIKWVGIEYE